MFMLLQKRNRIEELTDSGHVRKKTKQHCSNCLEAKHNVKTCTKPCTLCNFKTYCSPQHITKVGNKWIAKCKNFRTYSQPELNNNDN